MSTVKKNISAYTAELPKEVFDEIRYLFKVYNGIKPYVYFNYSSIGNYLKIYNHGKEIRDVWTSSGFLDSFCVPKRYVRMALDDAIGNIKNRWNNTIDKTKKLISANEGLSGDDRHYLFYVLKSRELLFNVLNCISFDLPEKFKGKNIDRRRLHPLLRRYIRKTMPNKSVSRRHGGMMVDQQMWGCSGSDFKLSGLKKGKRYKLKLNTDIKLYGNLRINIDLKKKRLKISNAIDITAKDPKGDAVIGIDKNYINCIDTSTENSYGEGFNEKQNKYTNKLNEKSRKRQYYFSQLKKHKKKGNKKKTKNIKKFNLGKEKWNRLKNREKEELKKEVNRAIRGFVTTEKPGEVVVENLVFQYVGKRLNKKVKNKLSNWLKGYIQERIEYICSLDGIIVTKVNAAYTSQICPSCGHFGERKKDIFYCHNCGEGGYSGHVAGKNVLDRKYDDEIDLYTPYKKVRSILEKRLSDKECPIPLDGTDLNRANQDLCPDIIRRGANYP